MQEALVRKILKAEVWDYWSTRFHGLSKTDVYSSTFIKLFQRQRCIQNPIEDLDFYENLKAVNYFHFGNYFAKSSILDIWLGSEFASELDTEHCVKIVRIQSYSGPYFPSF